MILKDLMNYWFKTNKRPLYKEIGRTFNVSGFHVYRLAHGKATRDGTDSTILNLLVEKKIIQGTRI